LPRTSSLKTTGSRLAGSRLKPDMGQFPADKADTSQLGRSQTFKPIRGGTPSEGILAGRAFAVHH
ncbi:hypothetical protein, partial [uncultured Bradyrhizobium sp.]|uniref:hypothetical protein n=1 Tax=uncultured Bradyrhizobium sp. TaxID=199684 RepID=UPI0027D966F9